MIVLRPGGVIERREDLKDCPEEFTEQRRYRWRFCQPPSNSEVFPLHLLNPPIAGIPFEQAMDINQRHKDELMVLPGVVSVGLGANGLIVQTTRPELIPPIIEGLPVIIEPPGVFKHMNHTFGGTPVRPLHGGALIGDLDSPFTNPPLSYLPGTLGGVALSFGKPWAITAAHLVWRCDSEQVVPCPPCDYPNAWCPAGALPYLSQCPHYAGDIFVQPVAGSPPPSSTYIGRVPRHTVLGSSRRATDVAAVFLDNDSTEGNGSLSVDRTLHEYGPFKGTIAEPTVLSPSVTMVTGMGADNNVPVGSNRHLNPGTITTVGIDISITFQGSNSCGSGTTTEIDQFRFSTSFPLVGGDSGSLVLNMQGDVVGMFGWAEIKVGDPFPFRAGGSRSLKVKTVLGFDAFYGTQTVIDNTIGVFRPSAARWYVDNGNGKLDATPCTSAAPIATRDQCFSYGASTDVPITGDWDNAMLNSPSNDFTVGAYRPTTDPTRFFLSNANPPGTTPLMAMLAGPSSFGYKPVTGKWRGNGGPSNAISKVGVFRPSTGGWYLDSGNLVAEGCGTDYCFSLAAGMYQAGDTPIAGDWNNDGVTTIGLFRRGMGTAPDYFYLSNVDPYTVRFNGTISSWTYAIPGGPGNFGYLPVVGDWTGTNQASLVTGWTRLGIFQPSSGGWYLDNGNFVFASCAEDQCPPVFGGVNDKPVTFGKSLVKAN